MRTSEGTCLPAVQDDPNTPFASAWARLQFYRVPSMPGAGDDETVIEYFVDDVSIDSCMGPTSYVGPVAMIASTAVSVPAFSGIGHGSPGSYRT